MTRICKFEQELLNFYKNGANMGIEHLYYQSLNFIYEFETLYNSLDDPLSFGGHRFYGNSCMHRQQLVYPEVAISFIGPWPVVM